jgi:hypothetical protein
MRLAWWNDARWVTLAAVLQTGCSWFAHDDEDDGGGGTADDTGGEASSASATASGSASASGGVDETGGSGQCYQSTTVGCTSLSWEDVVGIIQTIYLFQDSYYGYTEAEALALAEQLYDDGVVAGEWLRIVTLQDLGNGTWRAHVGVAAPDGLPPTDLDPAAFSVSLDGAAAIAPTTAYRLGEADPDDVHVELSVVIDDSGSIADCDANFVMAGVSHLFETLPPIYASSLIKFADDVYMAQARTDDASALSDAMQTFCTDRGATSLWDAIDLGLDDLPEFEGLRTVVVFTDGLDNDSSVTLGNVIDEAQAKKVPVFVLGLGLADMFALSNLALDTGGGLVYIHSGEQAETGFELVTSFVSDSWVIEFTADAPFESVQIAATLPGGETVQDGASPP